MLRKRRKWYQVRVLDENGKLLLIEVPDNKLWMTLRAWDGRVQKFTSLGEFPPERYYRDHGVSVPPINEQP